MRSIKVVKVSKPRTPFMVAVPASTTGTKRVRRYFADQTEALAYVVALKREGFLGAEGQGNKSAGLDLGRHVGAKRVEPFVGLDERAAVALFVDDCLSRLLPLAARCVHAARERPVAERGDGLPDHAVEHGRLERGEGIDFDLLDVPCLAPRPGALLTRLEWASG